MKNILNFREYKPNLEYKKELRREINLDTVRKSKDYTKLLSLGFEEKTSHQQELNNTLKFIRVKHKQREIGHDDVFYTIHPSGTIRRYNPIKSEDVPEGNGNDIKKFKDPFRTSKDYIKGIKFLYEYLKRKEDRGDYR
jgi:hypothetical protein